MLITNEIVKDLNSVKIVRVIEGINFGVAVIDKVDNEVIDYHFAVSEENENSFIERYLSW